MASVQSLKEDLLTCAICRDIFTDPCTLSCEHSFCRGCLSSYIRTRYDAIQSRTIPCAVCRQSTKVPNSYKPTTEWAWQVKPSLMLQGLMDKLHSQNEHIEGKDVCFLCEKTGDITAASSWCSDCEVTLCTRCVQMHREGPTTKKHDLFDLSQGHEVKQYRKTKCREHEGEQIRYICNDCDKAVCQTCCTIKHRACGHVVTIESLVPEMTSVLENEKHFLEHKMQELMAFERQEESHIQQLRRKKTETVLEIRSGIQSAISLLRSREVELLKELTDITDKHISNHQANVKSSQTRTQIYQQHCESIDCALQSETGMYDMYQICQSGVLNSIGGTDLESRKTAVVGQMKFTQIMDPLQKAILEMGKFDVILKEETPVAGRETANNTSILPTPELHGTVDIKHRKDALNPDPIDITVLSVSGETTAVVADYNNKCLKSVYTKKGRRELSVLSVSDTPVGLVKISEKRVAALLSVSTIVVADVRPKLVLISNLKLTKGYTCLTSLQDSTLALGSFSPSSVDIIDLNGHVIRSFTSSNTGLNSIKNPNYLCTTHEGNIVVSDWGSKSVYCLTPDGGVVFTHTPTLDRTRGELQGVTVAYTGDILLADSGSHRIMLLTGEGTFVRDFLTIDNEIIEPWSLCVDANKLYVCERGLDKCIKIYAFT